MLLGVLYNSVVPAVITNYFNEIIIVFNFILLLLSDKYFLIGISFYFTNENVILLNRLSVTFIRTYELCLSTVDG